MISVEVRDVLIPVALQNAMSMQTQAERERQARVILGDSERQVAEKFGDAARTYADNPTALHLRAMNMLYEGLKENATIRAYAKPWPWSASASRAPKPSRPCQPSVAASRGSPRMDFTR